MKDQEKTIESNTGGAIVMYQRDTSLSIDVRIENETVWLTQSQISDLFGVKQPAISKHLKNIFESNELSQDSVHSILEYTATDGKVYNTSFYNLDAILSVGYRVNSVNATKFRQWANTVLKDYLLKGKHSTPFLVVRSPNSTFGPYLKKIDMASITDYKRLFDRYQEEGAKQGISIAQYCQMNGIVYNQFERWYKQYRNVLATSVEIVNEKDYNILEKVNEEGVKVAATLFTIVETARQSGVNVRDYLVYAIREVMNGNKDCSTYTPQAYLAL